MPTTLGTAWWLVAVTLLSSTGLNNGRGLALAQATCPEICRSGAFSNEHPCASYIDETGDCGDSAHHKEGVDCTLCSDLVPPAPPESDGIPPPPNDSADQDTPIPPARETIAAGDDAYNAGSAVGEAEPPPPPPPADESGATTTADSADGAPPPPPPADEDDPPPPPPSDDGNGRPRADAKSPSNTADVVRDGEAPTHANDVGGDLQDTAPSDQDGGEKVEMTAQPNYDEPATGSDVAQDVSAESETNDGPSAVPQDAGAGAPDATTRDDNVPPPPPPDEPKAQNVIDTVGDGSTVSAKRDEAPSKGRSRRSPNAMASTLDDDTSTQSIVTIEEVLACGATSGLAIPDERKQRRYVDVNRRPCVLNEFVRHFDGRSNMMCSNRCREARYEYLVNAKAMEVLQRQEVATEIAELVAAGQAANISEALKESYAKAARSSSALYKNIDLAIDAGRKRDGDEPATGGSSPTGPQLDDVPRVSKIQYQSFFFDFELGSQPLVVGKATHGAGGSGASKHFELDLQCQESISQHRFAPGETEPLQTICPHMFNSDDHETKLSVPAFLANDILQRVPARTASNFRTQWPSVTSGNIRPASRDVGIHSGCPVGLHEALFVKRGRMRAVAFAPNQTAFLYPQVIKHVTVRRGGADGHSTKVVNRPHFPWEFATGATILSEEGPDLDSFPLLGQATGFEATVSQGEMLFLPAGFTVSWRYLAPTIVVRQCYLDASNLQRARSRMELEGLLDDSTSTLWKAISDPSFDTSMAKLPLSTITIPLPWHTFRHPNSAEAQDALARVSSYKGLPTNTDRGNADVGNALHSNRRFHQWQMDRMWHRTIEGLTRSRPAAPDVVKVGRGEVTLRWQLQSIHGSAGGSESSRPGVPDASGAASTGGSQGMADTDTSWLQGYVVTATPVTLDMLMQSDTGSPDGHHIGGADSAVENTFLYSGDGSERTLDGAEVLSSSGMVYATLSGLRPGTIYVFTVAALSHDMGKFTSSATVPIKTQGSTTPGPPSSPPKVTPGRSPGSVVVGWGSVASGRGNVYRGDDGGAAITGFRVEYRPAGGQAQAAQSKARVKQHWKRVNADAHANAITVDNLVPGMQYVFRVAVANVNGVGEPGPQSIPTTIPGAVASESSASGGGRGSHKKGSDATAPSTPQQSISGETSATEPCFGPRVVFDDRTETLHITHTARDGDDERYEIWAAHHSPRAFKLENVEVVEAEPLDASTPLRNGAAVSGRVALVERGAVPLRQKVQNAQRAGAVGVLIVDTSRACDTNFDQSCCPGGDKANGEGFAAQDKPSLWETIKIPSALMRHEDGQVLFEMLK